MCVDLLGCWLFTDYVVILLCFRPWLGIKILELIEKVRFFTLYLVLSSTTIDCEDWISEAASFTLAMPPWLKNTV